MKKSNNNWKALIASTYFLLVATAYYFHNQDNKNNCDTGSNTTIEEIAEETPITIKNNIDIVENIPIVADVDFVMETSSPIKSANEMARDVIAGKYGNGEERKIALTELGYNYEEICSIVNNMMANEHVEENNNSVYSNYFGYLKKDSIIYDKEGNTLYYIDAYQKAIILDNENIISKKHIIVNDIDSLESIEGYVDEENIGYLENTFIEVDISLQKLFVYYEDECILEANVITGNPNIGSIPGTNVGYTNILSKQYETTLNGPTWSNVYVDYFMQFNSNGEGFHDADGWRKNEDYTQDEYLSNGSHGCVNMKQEDVEILDQYTEVGTRVLIHN